MLTRSLVTVLALALAAAPACKADKSKPRLGRADAAPAAGAQPPIATGGSRSGAAAIDAGAAAGQPATEGEKSEPGDDKGEPKEPPDQPKGEPKEPPDQPKGGPKEPPGGEKKPANLKVLPGSWSLAQVNDFMKKQVSRGLGVKCTHCHQRGDYAADTNEHKRQARSMIQMTGRLNQTYFRGKRVLSCLTCHKGRAEPGD
jgi:hypothetical protein